MKINSSALEIWRMFQNYPGLIQLCRNCPVEATKGSLNQILKQLKPTFLFNAKLQINFINPQSGLKKHLLSYGYRYCRKGAGHNRQLKYAI